jgi:YidC/Oxa1 family membrane protein insertase
VVQNLFSLAQQQWVLRKYPPPPAAKDAKAGTGGTKPAGGGRGATSTQQLTRSKAGAGKGGKAGKDGKEGKDGKADEPPAIDGRKLAPKPGAKPANPKKVSPKGVPPSQNIPPKRKSSAPRKG